MEGKIGPAQGSLQFFKLARPIYSLLHSKPPNNIYLFAQVYLQSLFDIDDNHLPLSSFLQDAFSCARLYNPKLQESQGRSCIFLVRQYLSASKPGEPGFSKL